MGLGKPVRGQACDVGTGRESLMDDDLSEEQVNEELIPVSLQMAYTEAVSGQHEQALHALEVCSGQTLPQCTCNRQISMLRKSSRSNFARQRTT